MAKLNNYDGSVELISGIKQKNGGDFALMDAHAIQTREDGTRLDAEIEELKKNTQIKTDDTLTFNNEGVLSVNTTDEASADNTLPIKSSAVHTIVGNIEVLLNTI